MNENQPRHQPETRHQLAPGLYLLSALPDPTIGAADGRRRRNGSRAVAHVLERDVPEPARALVEAIDPASDVTAAAIIYGYMSAAAGSKPTVNAFVREVYLSRRAIGRNIRRSDDLSTKQALDLGRFARVCELLGDPSERWTCYEVAYACGFADSPTMSNWMKKAYDLRPSQIRRDPSPTRWKEALR